MSKELDQAKIALDRFRQTGQKAVIEAGDLFDILDPLIEAVENLEQQQRP